MRSDRSKSGKLTIMLVEDHSDTRRAVAAWLQRKGYTVLSARNRRTCLELAEHTPFQLLICDLQLPDGNGWDLLRELKTQRSFVAIATSGHGSPTDIQKSRDAGFLVHITKPYPVGSMLTALAEAERHLEQDAPAPDKPAARSNDSARRAARSESDVDEPARTHTAPGHWARSAATA